ncbi:hypothetical protein [Neotabrizicola sp. VNH66]|uniref:hypothetical protein n=1 Tax=Neotabrizicola sp. VNH66 TaxID=3400918 RepID=UPI003C0E3168
MADYFTHFSCLIDVGTPERAAAATAIYQRCRAEDEETEEPQYRGFDLSPQEEGQSGELWIRDDDSGDPDGVVAFVLRLAQELDLRGLWGFDFAHTASRPLLGSFGGGATVIDLTARKVIGFVGTQTWLAQALTGEDPDA